MSCDKKHWLLETKPNFKLLYSINYEDTIPLYMYRSENTGITVCIAEVEGPVIHGYFNIATETFDNDGLPCAVARLIFTNSKDDPYYGILFFWAERSLVRSINVLNYHDRTCFTMSAAGSEGFLNILPLYLDHILYPALEESAYLTEIHNITSKGNAGVMYCYARNEERTSHYNIEREMLQNLYPGKCGYKSVIQGTTENLRESTSNLKVRWFHNKFYTPNNLTIVITGKIQHDEIFQMLLPLEHKIMRTSKLLFKKPWKTPITQLTKSVEKNVNFPSIDETYGMVYVAWRGPSPVTEVYEYRGCRLLLRYLEMTNINPLKTHFVEKCDLFCKCRTYKWSDSVFNIMFMNVPVKHLQLITKESIVEVLNDICNNGINMETISTLIHQSICQYILAVENNPHTEIVSAVCNHIVHGNIDDEQYLDQSLNNIRELEKLKNETKEFFLNLFKTYFIDAPMVVVKGKPSLNEYLKLQEKEELKTAEQIRKLNKEALLITKEKHFQYAIRKQKNLLVAPCELLASVPIPGTKSITFHHIKMYSTETDEQHSKLNVKKLPFFTYLDDVKTNFVYLQVIVNTSLISTEYKNYIHLLIDVINGSPVKRDDQLLPYEVAIFDTIAVILENNINNIGNYTHSMSLTLQVELKKYEKSVQLCKELLFNSELTVENLKLSTARLIDNSKQVKVQGKNLVDTLMLIMLYEEDSVPFTCNMLQRNKFFNDVKERLDTEAGQKEVIKEIEYVRKTITSPKNMFVHMAVDVEKLTKQVSDVYAPWTKYFSDFVNSEKTKPNLIADWNLVKPFENDIFNGCIMGLECITSSFFVQTCRCITDIRHPDLPALIVCLKYFTQGPMRNEFRKKTPVDNFYFYVSVNEGLVYLSFFPATNLVSAYKEAKLIVETHSTEIKWEQHLFETAKSLAILDFIDDVKSIRRMTNVSLKYSCNNVPFDYVYKEAPRISAVTMDDLSHVTTMYVKPLFDPKKCKTAIVCNISKVAEIEQAFQKMNFNLKVYKSLEELNLNDGIY